MGVAGVATNFAVAMKFEPEVAEGVKMAFRYRY